MQSRVLKDRSGSALADIVDARQELSHTQLSLDLEFIVISLVSTCDLVQHVYSVRPRPLTCHMTDDGFLLTHAKIIHQCMHIDQFWAIINFNSNLIKSINYVCPNNRKMAIMLALV